MSKPSQQVDELLKALSSDDMALISIRNTLVEIMRAIGGPKQLGRYFAADVEAAPEGSPVRATMTGNLIRALQTYGADEEPDTEDPEELKAELKAVLGEMDARGAGRPGQGNGSPVGRTQQESNDTPLPKTAPQAEDGGGQASRYPPTPPAVS